MNISIPALICTAIAVMGGSGVWANEHVHPQHGSSELADTAKPVASGNFPKIEIVSPKEDATVSPTVAVVLETSANLSTMTMNNKAVGTHLHISIDNTTLMPMTQDLVRISKNQYRYVFELPVVPGKHTITVYWADAQHRTVDSTIRKVHVTVASPTKAK